MSYQVLSRKYRPQTFEAIAGQKHVTQTLQNAISQKRVAHGYMFTGPRGIGKTTVARLLAKSLNCKQYTDNNPCNSCINCIEITEGRSMDVQEIDGASNRGIDEIRDLREAVKYPPAAGEYRIYIIDEVHMLTHQAFNALLKTLEEPPPHVIFIMATTDPQKVPQTILSRTQRFDFRRMSTDCIVNYLSGILDQEHVSYDKDSLHLIAVKGDGSMRDSLSLLDQVIAYSGDRLQEPIIREVLGIIDDDLYLKMLIGILGNDNAGNLRAISLLIESGHSIANFISGFNTFLRGCLVVKAGESDLVHFDSQIIEWLQEHQDQFSSIDLLRYLELSLQFEARLRYTLQPRIALESLFFKLSAMDSSVLISELIAGTHKPEKVKDPQRKISPPPSVKKTVSVKPPAKTREKAVPVSQETSVEETQVAEPKEPAPAVPCTLDSIHLEWPRILSRLEKMNFKIAHFLEESELHSYSGNLLKIQLRNENGFTVKSLEKDRNAIEQIFKEVMGPPIRLKFLSDPNRAKSPPKAVKEPEKDHPLMMDVIEMFNGEIIR